MKINKLEAHDRLQHFIQDQTQTIWEGAEDCLRRNPDSLKIQEKCPYVYLFAHPRTAEDGVTKRLLWQPRLTKPKAQTNSYLFRATSHSDLIEICWLLPPIEMWEQYGEGKVCESNWTAWSIYQFTHKREELERASPDDLSDEQAKKIFKQILIETMTTKRALSAVSSFQRR